MSNEVDLGSGLMLRRPLKVGFRGYWEGHRYKIREGNRVREDLSETEGRIIISLMRHNARTPTQLANDVGVSAPSVLYNLSHLAELGIVSKVTVPGGRSLYTSNWEIRSRLSPLLDDKVGALAKIRGGVEKLAKLPLRQLRKELEDLTDDEFKEVVIYLTSVEEQT